MTGDLAIALALVALAAAGLALRSVHTWRRSHDRLGRALIDTTARLAALTHQLNEALDRLRQEARMTLALGDVAVSGDLGDVLTRLAESAVALTGARAAIARAVAADGELVVRATEEIANLPIIPTLEWPSEGARAMTFTLLRGSSPASEPHIGSGLAVPIGGPEGAPVGLVVALFDEHDLGAGEKLGELERLAARMAPAVAATRAAGAAGDSATRDPLTGLATRRLFYESLAREIARAQRHGAPLALLLLDIDDFRSVNERVGRRAADLALRLLAGAVEAVAPPGALTCRIGGDELALILPGSNRLDVELVLAHVRAEHRDRAGGAEAAITVSSGVAELMAGDDALRLHDRAARSLRGGPSPGPGGAGESAREADENR